MLFGPKFSTNRMLFSFALALVRAEALNFDVVKLILHWKSVP